MNGDITRPSKLPSCSGSITPQQPVGPPVAPSRWTQLYIQAKIDIQNLARILRQYPSTLLWPLLFLAVIVGVGVWGVHEVAVSEVDSAKDRAQALAVDVAASFSKQLGVAYGPIISLATFVNYDPDYNRAYSMFNATADDLAKLASPGSIRSLQLSPLGWIRMVYPLDSNLRALGIDLFNATNERDGVVKTVRDGVLTLVGPTYFRQGGFGVRIRLPIFVPASNESETFGGPDQQNPYCGEACYNATTGSKFWGFATALIDLDALSSASDSRLRSLEQQGLLYELAAPQADANASRIAGTARRPSGDVIVTNIELPNADWQLTVCKADGWMPSWYAGLISAVVILGVAVTVLLFTTLLSRRQHQVLLEALIPKAAIRDLARNATSMAVTERIKHADTPADVLLGVLGTVLEGRTAEIRDVLFIRTAVLRNMDIYAPLNLRNHIKGGNLDEDVARALMRQLGTSGTESDLLNAYDDLPDEAIMDLDSDTGDDRADTCGSADVEQQQARDCMTLTGALKLLLTPSPAGWYDNGYDMHDAASDAALPAPGAEVLFGGAPSNPPSLVGAPTGPSLRRYSREMKTLPASFTMQGVLAAGGGSGGGGGGGGGSMATTPRQATHPGIVDDSANGAMEDAFPLDGSVADVGPEAPPSGVSEALLPSVGGGNGGVGFGGGVQLRPSLRSPLLSLGGPRKRTLPTVSSSLQQHGLGHAGGAVSAGQLSMPLSTTVLGGRGGGDDRGSRLGTQPNGAGMLASATSRRHTMPPPMAVVEEVERILAAADGWQFDTWRLKEVTQGHPLSVLGFFLMQRAGFISRFKLNPVNLARLLRHIEAGYPDNPYHNATHAADVLQTLHVLIHGGQLHVHYVDPLGLFAAYFAAIVHDYGHPGLTNDFLIATSDPLAVRYNDRSPLENHHSAAAFSVLRRSELDILGPLSPSERTSFRKQVIEMVMATDMKQHFSILSHFNTVHRLSAYSAAPASESPMAGRGSRRHLQAVVIGDEGSRLLDTAPRPKDDTERLLSLQVAIKVADLGHLGEALEVHRRWLGALEEEFFRQGDRERELGLPISPLFDRAKQGVSKSQVGFYEFVVLPLMHALVSAFPGTVPLMQCFVANYNHWRSVDGKPPIAAPNSNKALPVRQASGQDIAASPKAPTGKGEP